MANKQDFTPAEWSEILESAMVVGIAVSAADPNGLWGMLKEAAAGAAAVAASRNDEGANELVKAAVAELETSRGMAEVQGALRKRFDGSHPTDCVQRSLDCLRQVSALVDAKAPSDAAGFKAWLRGIGHKVAEASREGSFLGFGGVRVSDAEKATLADIDRALGAPT